MTDKLGASLRRSILKGLAVLGFTAATAVGAVTTQANAEVTIRLASDTAGLPHPAAIAMQRFKERVEAEIPGSSVRIFVSSSLYKIPEAMEAMTEGNLEMAWGRGGGRNLLERVSSANRQPITTSQQKSARKYRRCRPLESQIQIPGQD